MIHEILNEPMEELEEIDQEVALRENSAFLIFSGGRVSKIGMAIHGTTQKK